jgi:uncharacterized delta-60 repeat protein
MWSLFLRNTQQAKSARRTPLSVRPRLETLEDRCLLSGGALDPTFGTGGLVTTPIGPNGAAAEAVLTLPDGTLLAGGNSWNAGGTKGEFTLARYNTNGTLDTSFGQNGIVQTAVGKSSSGINGLTLETVGGVEKIVAVGFGYSNGKLADAWAVARYNLNGTLDTSFNRTGIVLVNSGGTSNAGVSASAVAIDGNGKIDVAGTMWHGSLQNFALLRLNANGSLDTTFGKNGIVTTQVGNLGSQASPLALQPDGKILVAGDGANSGTSGPVPYMAVARYTTTGQLDSSFGTNGIVTQVKPSNAMGASAEYGGLLVLNDGSILVGGSSSYVNSAGQIWDQLTLAKLTSTGQVNTSFGSSGFALDSVPGAALGPGAVALGFGANGDLVAGMTQVLHDSSGNVTQEQPAMAAFLPSGALDTTFGSNGTAVANFGSSVAAWAMTIQSDGGIVVAGGAANGFDLARFLASAPQIGSFTATPNPVTSGSNTTLTASNITDSNPNSTITQVAIYLDSNNDGTLEPGNDTLLGYATQTSPGVWTLTNSSAFGLTKGTYTLFGQAQDSDGIFGDPIALTLTVQ